MAYKVSKHIWIEQIVKNDDQRALRQLFDHYYPRLLNYAYYFLESKSAADEAISSVFIGLWNHRTQLDKIENFDGYIFRSVKNKALSCLRDIHRLHEVELASGDFNLAKTVDSPESKLITKELRKELLNALDELPPRCRVIFELVKQDGLKYKEVAELLEVSIKTVENQMGKAMSTLREKLMHLRFAAKNRSLNTSNR